MRRYGPDLRLTAKRGGAWRQRTLWRRDRSRRPARGGRLRRRRKSRSSTRDPGADRRGGDERRDERRSHVASPGRATAGRSSRAGKRRRNSNGEWRHFLRRFDPDGRRHGADIPVSTTRSSDSGPAATVSPLRRPTPRSGSSPRRRRQDASGSAHRRHARQDRIGVRDFRRRRVGALWSGRRRGKAGPVRSRGGLAHQLAQRARRPRGARRRPAGDGLGEQLRAEVQGRQDRPRRTTKCLARSRSGPTRPASRSGPTGTGPRLRRGGKPRWKQPGPGIAWGVDFSADGQILVVAYGDGTIRWLRGSDGVELLALFVEPQSRKWVAWTPTGYYMASAGGEDLIGWHLNRGWTQEADFFPASQFRALQPARHRAPRAEDARRGRGDSAGREKSTARAIEAKPIGGALPPVVAIASPRDGARISATFGRDRLFVALALRPANRPTRRAGRRPTDQVRPASQRPRVPERRAALPSRLRRRTQRFPSSGIPEA